MRPPAARGGRRRAERRKFRMERTLGCRTTNHRRRTSNHAKEMSGARQGNGTSTVRRCSEIRIGIAKNYLPTGVFDLRGAERSNRQSHSCEKIGGICRPALRSTPSGPNLGRSKRAGNPGCFFAEENRFFGHPEDHIPQTLRGRRTASTKDPKLPPVGVRELISRRNSSLKSLFGSLTHHDLPLACGPIFRLRPL